MGRTPLVPLAGGSQMPALGVGLYRCAPGEETRETVRRALALGYRHLDTASMYGNEVDVGAALRESGVPRDEVFVVTKLAPEDHGYDEALAAFDRSAKRMGLATVDLYLVHWPGPARRLESWRALERLHRQGRCRAIGVSNFTEHHLLELLERAEVRPAVNQVELHPFLGQVGLRALCRAADIRVVAYSPLTRGRRLDDDRLARAATSFGASPAQAMIRWACSRADAVVVKARSEPHLRDNLEALELEPSEHALSALDALDEGYRCSWDPSGVA